LLENRKMPFGLIIINEKLNVICIEIELLKEKN
jgi:hypothetical protein